jgi:excisionase family DNA binding protein
MSTRSIYTKMFKGYPDALNMKDLQKMLGISKNSAYKLVNENRVEHTKIGKRFVIPKASVIAFLQRNHVSCQ